MLTFCVTKELEKQFSWSEHLLRPKIVKRPAYKI